jgi:hypothetical protein
MQVPSRDEKERSRKMETKRFFRRVLLSLILTPGAAGLLQADESFKWRGEVDGVDEIQIRGNSVHIKHLKAQPIQSQDHRFTEPLPRRDVHLRLEKVEGRGKVRLVQEPTSWNNYTATVRIDDSKGGSDDYEFALHWRSDDWDDWENNDWDHSNEWQDHFDSREEGMFRWRGRVDIGAEIEIRGKDHRVKDSGGSGTQERQARFSRSLPKSTTPVSLHKIHGRGLVILTQYPNHGNDYTAIVRIADSKGGADDYEFELTWQR